MGCVKELSVIVYETAEVHPFMLDGLYILHRNQVAYHPHLSAHGALHTGSSHIAPVLRLQQIKPCQGHGESEQFYLVIGILQL